MKDYFTIFGGMGTFASMSFEQVFNKRTNAHLDQEYFNYLLVNHATVPDRTSYILDHHKENFLPYLLDDVEQQNMLEPRPNFIALACNTAHYFYDQLQASTKISILNMPKLTAKYSRDQFPYSQNFGLLATAGTVKDQVYEQAFGDLDQKILLPNDKLQESVNNFIYQNVKSDNKIDLEIFNDLLSEARDYFGTSQLILGCTELSYAAELLNVQDLNLIDAQSVLVDVSLDLARTFRKSKDQGQKLLKDYMS